MDDFVSSESVAVCSGSPITVIRCHMVRLLLIDPAMVLVATHDGRHLSGINICVANGTSGALRLGGPRVCELADASGELLQGLLVLLSLAHDLQRTLLFIGLKIHLITVVIVCFLPHAVLILRHLVELLVAITFCDTTTQVSVLRMVLTDRLRLVD